MSTLKVKRETDFQINGTILSNGSAVNITGYSFLFTLLQSGTKLFTQSGSIVVAGNGTFKVPLTDTQLDLNADIYDWSLVMNDGTNRTPLDGGKFRVYNQWDEIAPGFDNTATINIETASQASLTVNIAMTTISGSNALTSTNYTGSDCTGNSFATGRTLDAGATPVIIMVEGVVLRPTTDYTVSSNTVTFNDQLSDNVGITIWT